MKDKKTGAILSLDAILNPDNTDQIRSFTSCEDRCNKLEIRRTSADNSYT